MPSYLYKHQNNQEHGNRSVSPVPLTIVAIVIGVLPCCDRCLLLAQVDKAITTAAGKRALPPCVLRPRVVERLLSSPCIAPPDADAVAFRRLWVGWSCLDWLALQTFV